MYFLRSVELSFIYAVRAAAVVQDKVLREQGGCTTVVKEGCPEGADLYKFLLSLGAHDMTSALHDAVAVSSE